MAESGALDSLLAALSALTAWLKAGHVPHVVIGGVAVSLLSRPRMTRDVDAMVLLDQEHWADLLAAGPGFGFEPRLGDALAFALETRVLLVRHRPSGIDADIAFGLLPFVEQHTLPCKFQLDQLK